MVRKQLKRVMLTKQTTLAISFNRLFMMLPCSKRMTLKLPTIALYYQTK
jgi:hypothetical protein